MPGPGSEGPNPFKRFTTAPGAFSSAKAPPATTIFSVAAVSRIQRATTFSIAAVSRIATTTTVTTHALSRIQTATTFTTTAISRVQASTTFTTSALSRIQATSQFTIQARSRIGSPNLAIRPGAAPALVATYGAFQLNASNGIILTTPYDTADTDIFGSWYTEFRCRLTREEETGNAATDDAKFTARINALEAALKIPRQKLLVTLGNQVVRNLDFNQSTQTAFLITTELEVKIMNRRDYTYGFRVRNEIPFPLPTNFFRRDSDTALSTTLRENRSCEITALWTSSLGSSSLANYGKYGDTFFNAVLPNPFTDSFGTVGQWVRIDELPVRTNDEVSITTARRLYVEVFAGRRSSGGGILTTIGDRRVFTAPSEWLATSTQNALQNYQANGALYYSRLLANEVPVTGPGYSWVLVLERPYFNDPATGASAGLGASNPSGPGTLTVERVYHEVLNGLREYTVAVETLPEQVRHIRVRGTFYSTPNGVSAYQNFVNGKPTLISQVKAAQAPPVGLSTSYLIPRVEGYDQNQLRYSFDLMIVEITYPLAHPAITIQSLIIDSTIPSDPQSITGANPVTRLQTAAAHFTASVDARSGFTPQTVWSSTARAFVLGAVASQLGIAAIADVVEENVKPDLSRWTITGTLTLIVTGGSLLWLRLIQSVRQIPGWHLVGFGDGMPLDYWGYKKVAWKKMAREAHGEYVVAGALPAFFGPGDNVVSGFAFVDTGISAQDCVDALNSGAPPDVPGWIIDADAPDPYLVVDAPTTRGALGRFQTVVVHQAESWVYCNSLRFNS